MALYSAGAMRGCVPVAMMNSTSSSRTPAWRMPLQHRRQQMLMRHRARLVVDGDGDRLPGARRLDLAERMYTASRTIAAGSSAGLCFPGLYKFDGVSRGQIRL